ncbi:MAG: lactoylglutathione lyase [Colwellia sp.]|nr:lactoylglutathione lyase [Colwellia sp.]
MRRILHAMFRVGDLQRSIDFYTRIIGMRVLRTFNHPDEEYTLTFLGFGEESETCVLELTYNFGVSTYKQGNGFGHIAISVDNCKVACDEIREKGGDIILDAALLSGSNEIIAFVADPDGYKIELIQRTE